MKIKFYTFLLCILFLAGGAGLLKAQNFKFVQDTVTISGSAGSVELVAHNLILNTSSHTQTFRWYRFDKDVMSGWKTQICDNIQCYFETTGTADFELAPGDSSLMDVHFIPNDISGDSKAIIFLFAVGDSSNGKSAVYFANAWPLGVGESQKTKFNFYPNPVKEKLTIDFPTKGDHTVEIFNILGNKVGTYNVYNQNTMKISFYDLPKGMYILTYKSAAGKVITKTFTKD